LKGFDEIVLTRAINGHIVVYKSNFHKALNLF